MPQEPKAPAPVAGAKPAYTIVNQTKSRWWEVRGPDDELVCGARLKSSAILPPHLCSQS